MKGAEIRQRFLDFFIRQGHAVVESSPLVPYGDPTLLFTNAGMNQFKGVFLGQEVRPYTRATTAQRVVRAGGKHNDLDAVGKTARHHTFFEMMGNFSFGDYFKRDAIDFAWRFLTQELGLDPDQLWISVYELDDEAYQLWPEVAGVAKERIVKLGEKDNFWTMGDTGPCGPCSEIYVDRGAAHACDAPVCALGECDCDRWLEIWNLVFMQFDRLQSGEMTPLPRPSIDTGMGLERVASVLQGVSSNFETDLFMPLIGRIEQLSGQSYASGPTGFPFRVLADHARSSSFLITDGVLPSNEGRGYVLRRIIRRAIRIARTLSLSSGVLAELVPTVVESLGDAYPVLRERQKTVELVLQSEGERFSATLEAGFRYLDERVDSMLAEGKTVFSGHDAFVLYDTYGFPVDLTEEILLERGYGLDRTSYEKDMDIQKARARQARDVSGFVDELLPLLGNYPTSKFTGYASTTSQSQLIAVFAEGDKVRLLLDQTPFYPEGGGQIGDEGAIIGDHFEVTIEDTKKTPTGHILHLGTVKTGTLRAGATVIAEVDKTRRTATMRNHTATHLLHAALRKILGDHVFQAGSVVEPERLRFDFQHFQALTTEQLMAIEQTVNEVIWADTPTTILETTLAKAKKEGVMALFGEKYADQVRVVEVPGFSKELCGGTHVQRTGEIGLFKIVTEGAVASGVRRIEAVTGSYALSYVQDLAAGELRIAQLLKTTTPQIEDRVVNLLAEAHQLELQNQDLWERVVANRIADLLAMAESEIIVAELSVLDVKYLRMAIDRWRDRRPVGAIMLYTKGAERVDLIAGVSEEAISRGLSASSWVNHVVGFLDGRGGGRDNMAQGGGKNLTALSQAISEAENFAQAIYQKGGVSGGFK